MSKALDLIKTAILEEDENLQTVLLDNYRCLFANEWGLLGVLLHEGSADGGGGGTGDPGTDHYRVLTPLDVNTSADHVLASNTTVGASNIDESSPIVIWNGRVFMVGDGDRDAQPFYVTGDSGATARAHTAIVTGDKVAFNPLALGIPMVSTDSLLIYFRK